MTYVPKTYVPLADVADERIATASAEQRATAFTGTIAQLQALDPTTIESYVIATLAKPDFLGRSETQLWSGGSGATRDVLAEVIKVSFDKLAEGDAEAAAAAAIEGGQDD